MTKRIPHTQPEQPTVNVQVGMPSTQEKSTPVTEEEKSPTWFWDMLRDIPEHKWGKTNSVIAWRTDPKVPGQPGSKGFLFEAFQPITLQWMKDNYGGGQFRCVLQENSRFKTTHNFEIVGQPKFDLSRENPNGVLPSNNGNGNAGNDPALLRILEQQISKLNDQLSAAQSRGENNPALAETVSILSTGYREAIAAVKDQIPGSNDAGAQLANLLTAAEKIANIRQPSGSSTLDKLLEAVLPKLLERLVTPQNPLDQMAQFLGIFEKLDALRGGGGGDSKPKDWRAMLAEGAVQRGPEILKELRETFDVQRQTAAERRVAAEANARAMEIARSMPQPGAAPAPGTAPAAASPVAPTAGGMRVVPLDGGAPQETAPQVAAAPVSQTPAADQPSQAVASVSEADAVANFMKRRIVEMIADGRDAEDIVEWVEDVDPTVNDLLAQFSAEMVTSFLSNDSILSKATTLKNWSSFLNDAQNYIKKIRAEDAVIDAQASVVPS